MVERARPARCVKSRRTYRNASPTHAHPRTRFQSAVQRRAREPCGTGRARSRPVARLLCRLPGLSGQRRDRGRALSARRRGAQPPFDRAAPVAHGARRMRSASSSRARRTSTAPPTGSAPQPADRVSGGAVPGPHAAHRRHRSACRSTSISGWISATACCSNTPPTRARASSASTTSTASRPTCRPATTSIPSSASASPNTPRPTMPTASSGRCGCTARATSTTSPSPTGRGPRLHHIGVWNADALDILHICDVMATSGYLANMERGPGRHGISNAFFLYIRDPDGHRVELFTSDYLTVDPDHEPIRWSLTIRSGRPCGASRRRSRGSRKARPLPGVRGARAGARSAADRGDVNLVRRPEVPRRAAGLEGRRGSATGRRPVEARAARGRLRVTDKRPCRSLPQSPGEVAVRDLDDAGARGERIDQRFGLGLVRRVEIGVPLVEQIDLGIGIALTISSSDLSWRSPVEKPSFLSIEFGDHDFLVVMALRPRPGRRRRRI